jgi:hypothetical protein
VQTSHEAAEKALGAESVTISGLQVPGKKPH